MPEAVGLGLANHRGMSASLWAAPPAYSLAGILRPPRVRARVERPVTVCRTLGITCEGRGFGTNADLVRFIPLFGGLVAQRVPMRSDLGRALLHAPYTAACAEKPQA